MEVDRYPIYITFNLELCAFKIAKIIISLSVLHDFFILSEFGLNAINQTTIKYDSIMELHSLIDNDMRLKMSRPLRGSIIFSFLSKSKDFVEFLTKNHELIRKSPILIELEPGSENLPPKLRIKGTKKDISSTEIYELLKIYTEREKIK